MTLIALQQHIDRLNRAFGLVQNVPPLDPLYPFLTQYLCVRVSGLLDQAIPLIYFEYARLRGSPNLARFVDRRLRRISNLKSERLCQVAGYFDSDWEVNLRSFIDEPRKAAVDSVVANRDRIAHGDPVGVGFVQLRDWYKSVLEVILFVETQTTT